MPAPRGDDAGWQIRAALSGVRWASYIYKIYIIYMNCSSFRFEFTVPTIGPYDAFPFRLSHGINKLEFRLGPIENFKPCESARSLPACYKLTPPRSVS